MLRRILNLRRFRFALTALLAGAASSTSPARTSAAVAVHTVGVARSQQLTGRIVQTLEITTGDPLLMPSDVAVEPDGGIAVADGVHNRIVRFNPDGSVRGMISAQTGVPLTRPLGLCVDQEGTLWIADTGSNRVVACGPQGLPMRTLPLPEAENGSEYTDVVLSADGRTGWVVDNNGHRLLRLDLGTGTTTTLGSEGTQGNEFHYPYLIASDARGSLYVSDVANGRVSVWLDDERYAGHLGGYGVEPGKLYRPKGVACDDAGRVWVSDGRLGVIQAFAPDGAFIDVLRDEEGGPLRFDTPSGIAACAETSLYVVEVGPGRVQRLSVTATAAPIRRQSTDRVESSRQPQTCTVCHLEWMNPLVDGRGTELVDLPENPIDFPLVSREENCFSCHDGSIADSRRRVWMEHGHASGVIPSPRVAVPAELPMSQGKVVCRTCHTAHTRGGSGNTLKDAVFLRVQSDPGELCTRCHADMTLGTEAGMHPVDIVRPAPVRSARRKGRPSGDDRPQCLTCHNPHGASENALLTQAASSPTWCIQCHVGMTELDGCNPGETPHPVTGLNRRGILAGPARDPSADATADPSCLSCHVMHFAPATDHLLAAEGEDSSLCLSCHAAQAGLLGTAHDLRGTRPEELNARGETSAHSGPCGACHGVHSPARAIDPAGAAGSNCATCHSAEGCAGEMSAQPFSHPVEIPQDQLLAAIARIAPDSGAQSAGRLTCTVCHDPHQTAHSYYLRAAPYDLCVACHTGFSTRRGTPLQAP